MWALEWLLNRALDVVFPPAATLLLLFWMPVLNLCSLIMRSWNWARAKPMRGKVVLITGASSGIGEALAYEFARRHATLVLTGLRLDRLKRVAQRCSSLGAERYSICEGDTSTSPDCKRMVDAAMEGFGQLDVLVNNAGVTNYELLENTRDINALRHVVDVDFFGYMWMTLHALPYLRRTQGSILVNVSTAAWTCTPRSSAYSAANGAVTQFFDTLRVEPAGRDVSITLAFAGATASEMTAGKAVGPEGEMEVDTGKRDLALGPKPMMRASTVAQRMVSGMLARAHYVIVPFWTALPLWMRIFTPEAPRLAMRLAFFPLFRGAAPPAKLVMDAGGREVLYHAPARQEEAEAAVYGQEKMRMEGMEGMTGMAGKSDARPAGPGGWNGPPSVAPSVEAGEGEGMMQKVIHQAQKLVQPVMGVAPSASPESGPTRVRAY